MTKRMVIMLATVAIVFGGIFGFQAFKAAMIKKFMSSMSQPPQTVSDHQGRHQPLAAEHRSGRQPARGQWRRSVAGGFRRGRFAVVQFRRRRRAGRAAAQAAFRGRSGQAGIAAGDRGAEPDHLRPRPEAVQAAGRQPGHHRHRCGQFEERQGAGRPAAGHPRQEIPARAVRRPSRHPRRRPRPISRRRDRDRHAAGARSDLSRFLRAAAVDRSGATWASRWR